MSIDEFKSGVEKVEQWRKKCGVIVSVSLPWSHKRFNVSLKLCLNLCSGRWMSPRHNLVGSLIPYRF